MTEGRVRRRLAAILWADVVGYSRLMGRDEAGTLDRLKAMRRELVDPQIAAHSGRMVKLMGDGAVVEFASAVDAVTCSIEIQKLVREHNSAVPEDDRIEFRIGINVGDIIVEGDDIYGDGVNVEAFSCFLRGREKLWDPTRNGNIEARRLFDSALNLDPDHAAAHAGIGFSHINDFVNAWADEAAQSLETGIAAAQLAIGWIRRSRRAISRWRWAYSSAGSTTGL